MTKLLVQVKLTMTQQVQYGSVTVNWKICEHGHLQHDAVPPQGVRVFYRKEKNKITGMNRIIVVAYVHDKIKNQVHFQHCIWNQDRNPKSVPFSRPTHRYTALVRLLIKPLSMDLPLVDYFTGSNAEYSKYLSDQDFDWFKYENRDKETEPGLFNWTVFEDRIRRQLMHVKYRKVVNEVQSQADEDDDLPDLMDA